MTMMPGAAAIRAVDAVLSGWLYDVVYLGGSVLPLLISDPIAYSIRPTEDIDIIVEVVSRHAYSELEDELRRRGFRNDTSEGARICRWLLGADPVVIDIMPTDPTILGFSNQWYPYTLRTAILCDLGDGTRVQVISPVAFLATKIEAFRSPERRFSGDFRASHDLEDIVSLLDGRPELEREIAEAEPGVRTFLAAAFRTFLAESAFVDAIPGHLEPGPTNVERSRILLGRLERIAARSD